MRIDPIATASTVLLAAGLMALGVGCASNRSSEFPERPFAPSHEPMGLDTNLGNTLRLARTISGQLDEIQDGLSALHRRGSWQARGYFDEAEHDAIEQL